MIRKITISLVSLLILSFFSVSFVSAQDIYSYYDEGRELLRVGDWVKAINKWMSGKTMLMAEEKADPRIGMGFIELITRKELNHFYVQACEMYMWGFSTKEIDRFKDSLIEEANRILPLIRESEQEIWKNAIKKDVSAIPYLIKDFWLRKDPTPTTPANERLLEHFKRIAYSREEYIRMRNSVYNTDDRGLIYVKYGEPDVKKTMMLGNNESELAFWLPAADKRRDINSLFNTFPDVEIWIYNNLDLYQPVLYIFGKAAGMPFHLYDGVEEFIPSKAFNNRFVMDYGRGLHPGTLIQLMMYDDLRLVDYRYESRYNEIANVLGSPALQNPRVLRGMRDRYKAEDAASPVKKSIPKDKSDYEFMINEVKMNNTIVRLLDETNTPKLTILAISYPQYMREGMQLTHTLIIRDKDLNEVTRFTDAPEDPSDNASVFTLDHSDPGYKYTIGSMVPPPIQADTLSSGEAPRVNYPSIGKELFEDILPLNPDEEKLEVSDLVYGIELPESGSVKDLPFPVLPVRQISASDALVIYFELYHLFLDKNNQARYEVKFKVTEIERENKSLLDKLKPGFGKKTVMSQDNRFNANSRTVKDKISFNIDDLQPGSYEFSIEVKDLISKDKVERKGQFRVVK